MDEPRLYRCEACESDLQGAPGLKCPFCGHVHEPSQQATDQVPAIAEESTIAEQEAVAPPVPRSRRRAAAAATQPVEPQA